MYSEPHGPHRYQMGGFGIKDCPGIPQPTEESRVWVAPVKRTSLIWAAVDFDGTIAKSEWTPENPTYAIGDPMPEAKRKLESLLDVGFKPIIHTARPWADYEMVESWLEHHGMPFKRIVCGKLLADMYVDDRSVNATAASWHGGVHCATCKCWDHGDTDDQ